ncbi:MAG TPA: GNAT family N-acetyltransferase [Xanthobacteraceae bacterium]|jgi:ribosomal-protein-alanine N-acetyltransferase|nr:GNAT family N-acetyltransferase [Xanthobacteraceae bacterium]
MSGFFARLFQRPSPAIAEARPRDARECAALHAQSFPVGWSESEMERLLLDPSVIGHVTRGNGGRGAALAFIMSRVAADEAEILSVAVALKARGRGLAGDLLRQHLARVAARGAAKMFLEVGEDNAPALRLYAKAGFREVGKRPGYYPHGTSATGGRGAVSALILRRELA